MHNALLVVAKRPVPGQTKTRLSPPLSAGEAADLYDCFLRDTLEIMRRVPDVRPAIAYLPAGAHTYFRGLAPDMDLRPQRGESLGERLDCLLSEALSEGAVKAVVLDSDSPTLPVSYVQQAFQHLDHADVVLGPTADGGYYLIGMKKPHPQLLREVQMSTPRVCQDTLALAAKTGVSVSLLPAWYDVDTVADLRQLQAEVDALKDGVGQHTRQWLMDKAW